MLSFITGKKNNMFKCHIVFKLSLAKWTESTKSIKWHGQQRQQRGECYNATIGFDEGRKQENGQMLDSKIILPNWILFRFKLYGNRKVFKSNRGTEKHFHISDLDFLYPGCPMPLSVLPMWRMPIIQRGDCKIFCRNQNIRAFEHKASKLLRWL